MIADSDSEKDADPDGLPRRVSAEDLAEIFGCTSRTIRNYAKQGIVKRSRQHGKYYFSESVKGILMHAATGKTPDERADIDADLDGAPYLAAARKYR